MSFDFKTLTGPLSSLAGCRVCITVENDAPTWPLGVRIGFFRENRQPSLVMRSPRFDRHGTGKLYCWIPKGAICVQLVSAQGLPYEGKDLRLVGIRRVSLLELGARVGLNTPRKLIAVLRMILAGNHRGEAFRFARAVDELNALPYGTWLTTHRSAIANVKAPGDLGGVSILVTVSPSTKAQMNRTLASLNCQSWKAWRLVSQGAIAQFRSRQEGRFLWVNLPAGAVFESYALEQLVQPFCRSDVALVYSDEDVIGRFGRRHSPTFKPAWSPLLVESRWMSLEGALVDIDKIGADLDFTTLDTNDAAASIEAVFGGEGIVHLPRVLLSRPCKRRQAGCQPKIVNAASERPRVSVAIPTRNRCDLLQDCIEGLQKHTIGVELDIIIVDNGSDERDTLRYLDRLEEKRIARVIRMPGSFNFSRACNLAVDVAEHELILLLNNDVTPISADWLVQMSQEISDSAVGAVGAYLLYPDGLVQHAGVTLGAGSVARHSFSFIAPSSGEDRGLLSERRDVSAVTAACLMTTKSLWRAVDGMDEQNLAVAFNDVDYCLKLRRIGKRIIWTPRAKLWHHESVSRGKDNTEEKLKRFAHEEATMHSRWGVRLRDDPFHNPNLSKSAEDFVLETFPATLAARTSKWN